MPRIINSDSEEEARNICKSYVSSTKYSHPSYRKRSHEKTPHTAEPNLFVFKPTEMSKNTQRTLHNAAPKDSVPLSPRALKAQAMSSNIMPRSSSTTPIQNAHRSIPLLISPTTSASGEEPPRKISKTTDIEKRLEQMKSEHLKEIADLKSTHADELQKQSERLLVEHRQSYSELVKKVDQKWKAKNKLNNKTLNATITELKAKLAEKDQENSELQKRLDEMTAKQDKLDQISADVKKALDEKVEKLETTITEKCTTIDQQKDMLEKAEDEVKKLKMELDIEKGRKNSETFNAERITQTEAELKASHATKVSEINRQWQSKITTLETQYAARYQEMDAQMEAAHKKFSELFEVLSAQSKYQTKWSNLFKSLTEDDIDELQMEDERVSQPTPPDH